MDAAGAGVYENLVRIGQFLVEDGLAFGADLQAIGVYEAACRQPLVEMGAAAAELVLTLAAGKRPPQARVELATR